MERGGERDWPCWWRGWGDYSHAHSVANERGITTWQCLIGLLFRNQNGWLHSDVIRTWLRWAGRRSTASATCFYWIVLHWMSDDMMLYCFLMHIWTALIHKPRVEGVVRHFITPIAIRVQDEIAVVYQWTVSAFVSCTCLLVSCVLWRMAAVLIEYLKTERLFEISYCLGVVYPWLWDVCFYWTCSVGRIRSLE